MHIKTLLFLLAAGTSFAADTPKTPKPIAAEYVTLMQGIGQQVQDAQTRANAAVKKLESAICRDVKIKPADCVVDWRAGTVSKKQPPTPKPEPKPSEKPPAK